MLRFAFPLVALWALAPLPLSAEETVTSDTVGYCDALATRMAAREAMPPDARLLLAEGQAMCQRGHVAGGLRRLRMAVLITRGHPPPP